MDELVCELEKRERESLNCTQALRLSRDRGLGDQALGHVINYPFLITYLGLLAFWVVVIWLILG
jgi:hypothetical protein